MFFLLSRISWELLRIQDHVPLAVAQRTFVAPEGEESSLLDNHQTTYSAMRAPEASR